MGVIFKSIEWNILFVLFSSVVIYFLIGQLAKVIRSIKTENYFKRGIICFLLILLIFVISVVAIACIGGVIYEILITLNNSIG